MKPRSHRSLPAVPSARRRTRAGSGSAEWLRKAAARRECSRAAAADCSWQGSWAVLGIREGLDSRSGARSLPALPKQPCALLAAAQDRLFVLLVVALVFAGLGVGAAFGAQRIGLVVEGRRGSFVGVDQLVAGRCFGVVGSDRVGAGAIERDQLFLQGFAEPGDL